MISGEQGNKGQIFEGNRGTKTILGNTEHKKTNFRFWGNMGVKGTSQFISGEQGNRYSLPLHWEGLNFEYVTVARLIRAFFAYGCAAFSHGVICTIAMTIAFEGNAQ